MEYRTMVAVTAGMVGTAALAASALTTAAFATTGDSNSSVRGSLGVSLGDLSLDTGSGSLAFMLNASFALVFLIGAHRLARGMPQPTEPPRGRFTGTGVALASPG